MKRKGQNALMREKKKIKTDDAESLNGEAETAVLWKTWLQLFKCFNGRFLRTCFFADGVCIRNGMSLDLLVLEPFWFFLLSSEMIPTYNYRRLLYSLYALRYK